MSRSGAWSAILLGMLLGTVEAAQAPGLVDRLRRDVDQAEASLVNARDLVEQRRRDLIAAIEATQTAVRQAETDLDDELQALDRTRQQVTRRETVVAEGRSHSARLARRLAGEGIRVDPRSDLAALHAAWPRVTAAIDQRLAAFAQGLQRRVETTALLDRHGRSRSVPVWHWGAAQRVALGETAAGRGLCLRLDDGSWQVAGPSLPDQVPGHQLIDISGRLAATRPSAEGAWAVLDRAGPFVWPILALAMMGLVIIADRLWLLWRWRLPRDLVDRVIADLDDHRLATAHLDQRRTPTTQVLRELVRPGPSDDQAVAAMSGRAGAALVEAETRLQRGLRLLAVLAAAAPLLGLLGTVTGMITSFRALDLGGGGNAGQLSAGIGEALLTTEFGLIVAVPLLLAHAIFARDAQRRRGQAESAAMRLLAVLRARLTADESSTATEVQHA